MHTSNNSFSIWVRARISSSSIGVALKYWNIRPSIVVTCRYIGIFLGGRYAGPLRFVHGDCLRRIRCDSLMRAQRGGAAIRILADRAFKTSEKLIEWNTRNTLS